MKTDTLIDISSHSNPAADTHPSCDPDHPHHRSKGRKGDPRMHQAVAARIDNPNLTLFQALQSGGFEYPTDDDAACVDSENVTLGQRKNQLSRRIRLAKKQLLYGTGDPNADPGTGSNGSHSTTASQHQHHRTSPSVDPGASIAINNNNNQDNNNNSKLLLAMDSNSMRPLSGMKRGISENTADSFTIDNAAGDADEDPHRAGAARIKAKNHPEFHPIIVPRIASTPNNDSYSIRQSRSQSFDSVPPPPPLNGPTTSAGGEAFGMRFQQLSQHGRQAQQQQPGQQQQQQQHQSSHNRRHYEHEQQQHQQQQHGHRSSSSRSASSSAPSGVAVASLSQTAASVGLTLEQLALTLSSSSNLAQLLAQTEDASSGNGAAAEKLHVLALHLYQNEARALYQKAMLLAGYRHGDCREGSSKHLQFALAAWQIEGKRLQSVREQMVTGEAPLEVKPAAIAGGVSVNPNVARAPTTTTSAHGHGQGPHDQGHGHGHSHEHNHHGGDDGGELVGGDCYLDGRHIHRLEGKCGHKAILHQPADGTAHIDFLVGDKVECYHGVKPIAPFNSVNISVWPSKYKCEDLSCPDKCNDKMMSDHSHSDGACASVTNPKILELQDIDLDGKEWNLDFSNGQIDETLLGLFKLGGVEGGGNDGFPQGSD
jgi:hypothetical protein